MAVIFEKKTWVDRSSEFPGRRNLKDVVTGGVMTVDVTRNEGEVSQAGDPFSAENMNNLETRIDEAFADYEETKESFKARNIIIPASGWSSTVPYTNAVPVEGVTAADDVDITFRPTEGATNAQNILAYESYISMNYADTGDGVITFYAMEDKPSSNITVAIKGIRG